MQPVEFGSAGLGLRRGLLKPLGDIDLDKPDFLELSPENWIGIGGSWGKQLRAYTDRYPVVAHGLSLSLGSTDPLDVDLVSKIKSFLAEHGILRYSEHLSYCSVDGHLYDLMPIPFTEEAVHHTAGRIRQVQDMLGQRIAIENISYYAAPFKNMPETDFINAVLSEADCDLLLDVNNVYVNSVNHGYDPREFISALPASRIAWLHVAGHDASMPDFLLDTHGTGVADPVWDLLRFTYQKVSVKPTLLERDFNYPAMDILLAELAQIRMLQAAVT
ncbi:MAG TPA: DUF692 domain-containing protein [Pseudomonadales bacterium]|nr:DUF692 domain-containing protein [Pseudomonadales bacterium]